ncbi:hypothetical protein, partial [Vibrio vulnificus]|uniref:hypothetical protein n=1 Tax=Vibrio vulnificus TaxID=672 RepID=UPI0019D42611
SEESNVGGYTPLLPYPQAVQKATKTNEFIRYLVMLKMVQVNIPFLKVLTHMPKYGKFLKEIVSRKRKLEEFATALLTEECNAVI